MSDASAARVVIDLDVPGPTISRHLYGHFAEHLGRCVYDGFYVGESSELPNEGGIRLDVVEALRALNIPNLRWPGGCFADEYHWMNGVGPREDRPGDGEHQLGQRDGEQPLRHPRVHGAVRAARRRAVRERQRRQRHRPGDERLGRVPDPWRRQPDGPAPQGQRARRAVEGAVLGCRQRGLGLRRQYDRRGATSTWRGSTPPSARTTTATSSTGSPPAPPTTTSPGPRV